MLIIESLKTGEIIETNASNWRNGLNATKHYMNYDGIVYNVKATTVINNLPYNDGTIKAEIISGDWKSKYE